MTALPPDLRAWVDSQAEPERAALARAWTLADLAAPAAPSADAAWSRLSDALDVPPSRAASRWAVDRAARRASARRRVAWTVAAAALAVVVAGAALWLRPVTVEAGRTVAEIVLSDGSRVALAPGTTLKHRRGLGGDARRVFLEGQAVFEVAADGRPFVVETFNARAEVLGTAFDVLAWPDGGETAVAVLEGSVRLRSAGGSVALAPGEVSRVVGGGSPLPAIAADVTAVAAWRGGAFSVVDAPLAAVAAAVGARFGQPVALGDGVDGGRRLTLFLPHAETADAVLADVAAYLGLRLQAGPDRFSLLAR